MRETDTLEIASVVVAAALQSGKMPSYESEDVAAYFENIFICVEKCKQMLPNELINRIKD